MRATGVHVGPVSRRLGGAAGWAGLVLVIVSGCLGPWRPGTEQVAPHEPAETVVTPATCLEAIRAGRWVYERRELTPGADTAASDYIRVIRDGRMLEVSEEVAEFPHEAFAERPSASQPTEWMGVSEHGGKRRPWVGLRIEAAEPVDPFPAALIDGNPVTTTTSVAYAARTGPLLGRGTLTHRAELEGFEDVVCPAGRFERCLRLRVNLTVRFPLTPIMDWTTYVWLHPEAGEVRRVQRSAGWFWLFWFGSAHEYLLKSYELLPHEPVTADSPVHWSTLLVVMDRTFPHPRVAALSVEMAASRPAP